MTASLSISRELQTIAKELDERLTAIAGKRVAFSLLIWSDDVSNYISTGERKDVIIAMRELLQHWESGAKDIPAHLAN